PGPGSGGSSCRRSTRATTRSSRAACWRSASPTSASTPRRTCSTARSTRASVMRARGLGAVAAGAAVLLLLALAGAVAPLLVPDPYATDLAARLAAPHAGHALGQDSLGRAVLAREFVQAAQALGAGPGRIVARHLLPLAAPILLVQATFGMAGAIVAESSLSFLGLGAPPPLASWGAMIDEGRPFLLVAPHVVVWP